MPNIKSAKKRMVLSDLAREKNRSERSRLRSAVKRARDSKGDQAKDAVNDAFSLLDQAAQERLVHPNKAARLKSQLARHLNQAGAKK
jgi:small subunit ribosomal protein S20